MRLRFATISVLLIAGLSGAVVDRIAVAVDNRAIKESQVELDIRLTAFLNGTPVDTGAAAKRKAAERLIDQTEIRAEMAKGSYPAPSDAEVRNVLEKIKQARFRNNAEYEQALKTYSISEPELKAHIGWQIQVLKFVDLRFAKAAATSNEAFFSWLDASRKHSRIQFHDEVLQ